MQNKVLSILIRAQDEASAVFETVGDKLQNVASKMVSASLLVAKTGGIALAGALTLAAKASWNQVDAVQQATVGLKAYESNGDKVNTVLKNLITYARSDLGVLFNRKDLFQSAQSLKLMGDNTDDLVSHVKILSRSVGLGLSNWDELNLIVGRVGSTGKLAGDDFDNLTKAGYKLDPSLRNTKITFSKLFDALNKGIPITALEGQAGTIQGLGIRMQTAFRGVGDAILGVDSNTSQFVQGGLGDKLTNGLARATEALKTAKPYIALAMSDILTQLDRWTPALKDAAGYIRTNLVNAFTFAKSAFDTSMGKITDGIDKLLTDVKQGDWGKVGTDLGTALAKGISRAAGLMKAALTKSLDELGKIDWVGIGIKLGKNVPALLIGLAAGIINFDLGGLLKGVGEHWADILLAVLAIGLAPAKWALKISEMLTKIPFAGKLLAWFFDGFSAASRSIVGFIGDLLSAMGRGFIEKLGLAEATVIPAIKKFLDLLPTQIGIYAIDAKEWMVKMMEGLGGAIAEHGPKQVVAGLNKLKEAIFGYFTDAYHFLWEAGKNIVWGLKDGMISVLKDVKDAAGNVAKTVADKVKSVLGIHSPSKVFYGFGTNIVQGLVNGMSDNSGLASNAMADLISPPITGAASSQSVSAISSLTSKDVGLAGSSNFNMYGNITLGSADAVDSFFTRINAQKEMGAMGVGV